jgi:hypothetical protein
MKRIACRLLTVLCVMLGLTSLAQVSQANAPAPLSAPGTFYQTYIGTDFHSLERFAS